MYDSRIKYIIIIIIIIVLYNTDTFTLVIGPTIVITIEEIDLIFRNHPRNRDN